MVVTGCESHYNGCGQDVRTLCLCITAIVISIVSLTPALSAVSRDCRRACGARGRRWAPRSLQWQTQYPEPPDGAAARVVAAGPPAVLRVTAIVICKAMVVTGCESHCNGCGQDVRTRCLCTTAIVISIVSLTPALSAVSRDCRRACGARGRRWAPRSLSAVAGAVPRASRRGCGARGRRWAPCGSVRYCHCDLQSNGCDRLRIAL